MPDTCRLCGQPIQDDDPVLEVRRARVLPSGHVATDRWFPTRHPYQHADPCAE